MLHQFGWQVLFAHGQSIGSLLHADVDEETDLHALTEQEHGALGMACMEMINGGMAHSMCFLHCYIRTEVFRLLQTQLCQTPPFVLVEYEASVSLQP